MVTTRLTGFPAALLLSLVASIAAAAPVEHTDQILIQGIVSGTQTVADQGTGSVRAEYSFNDRGRGDHIIATWKLDSAGVPTEYSGNGNDYMKATVAESFTLAGGKAAWKNRAEQGGK